MTNMPPRAVKNTIKKYEKDGIILKYKTVLNKELIREDDSEARALIEVKVMPKKNVGFDYLAERIYQFPEVSSCYLMSGTYDLLLVVEGKNLKTISNFVSEKLSPMESVTGTVTHFILQKYKEDGDILRKAKKDKRQAITL